MKGERGKLRGDKSRLGIISSLVEFTAISRKVVRKRARDNPERYCGWF